MSRYVQHFMAGVRADVQQLVAVDFEALDPQALHNLFDAVMILKIAHKTLPSYVWKQCGAYRNGLISYKRMNSYLESYMGAKQKAEMALRRQWGLEDKKRLLRNYVETPSTVKKKEQARASSATHMLREPVIGGLTIFESAYVS